MNYHQSDFESNTRKYDIDVNNAMFRTRIFLMSELIDMLDSGKLRLISDMPFRRCPHAMQCQIVENMILGLPSATVVIDASDPVWYVVEGEEILFTFRRFLNNRFRLDEVNFTSEIYFGKTFSGHDALPFMVQRRLMNIEIISTIADSSDSWLARLWLHNAAKRGIEHRLWDCVPVILPRQYNHLMAFGSSIGLEPEQSHTLWLALMTACDRRNLTRPYAKDDHDSTDDIRFDFFECSFLKDIDNILSHFPSDPALLAESVRHITACHIRGDVKRTRCFAMTLTLLTLLTGHLPPSGFADTFNAAWETTGKLGKGYMYQDYARRVSAIYHKLTDNDYIH